MTGIVAVVVGCGLGAYGWFAHSPGLLRAGFAILLVTGVVFAFTAPSRTGRGTEGDVGSDPAVANARDTGGKPDPTPPDQHSTTGTTPNETFVGRVSGEDPGTAHRSGAEQRAWQADRRRSD